MKKTKKNSDGCKLKDFKQRGLHRGLIHVVGRRGEPHLTRNKYERAKSPVFKQK